jgi:hypothetical protein
MSKANDSTTTISTRRAFLLRSAPVAAAVVMVGGATAVEAAVAAPIEPIPAASPAADPIFALIEQHRAAIDEEKRTRDIFEQCAEAYPLEDDNNRGVVVGECPRTELEKVIETDADGVSNLRWFQTTRMRPIVVFIPKMIANYAPKDLGEAWRAAWIKDKTNELRRNKRAYKKRNENSARSLAWDAWNEAGKVTDGLSKQIIETSPTTVAGVAAVLAHWSKIMDEDEHDRDFISTGELLKNLAKGIKAIG